MKIHFSLTSTIDCRNLLLALTLSIGLNIAAADAQVFTDNFDTSHLYWQEFGTIDLTGTIWDGLQGAASPEPNFASQVDANITNPGQLTIGIFDEPVSNSSTGNAFDAAALYRDVTGDFDAKVRMPTAPADTMFLTLSLGAWTADQVNAIHVDNIWGLADRVRFRDQAAPDENRLPIPNQNWFRLQRNGNIFTAFYGEDGLNWTQFENTIVGDYGDTLRVGLAAWNTMPVAFDGIFDDFEIVEGEIVDPTSFEWNRSGLGDWSSAGNWTIGGPPNANDHTAVFGSLVGEPTTVVTNADVTANRIEFNNPTNSYAVSGLGSVSLVPDNGTDPTIEVTAGSHQMQVAVNLGGNTSVDASGGGLDFNNEISTGGNDLTTSGNVNINHSVTGGGNVNSSGTLGTAGSTSISANLESAGTLDVDSGDLFSVIGTANLSGLLDIDVGGVAPAGPLTVLSATGGITQNLTLGGPDMGLFTGISVQGNNLLLTVGGLTGDYNGDGIVNAADYTVWRNNLGANDLLNRNPNAMGPVGQADYDAWKTNFGNSAASGAGMAAVPEPTALVLLLLPAVTLILRRKT